MYRKIPVVVFAIAFSLMFTAVVPSFAKNLNFPSGTILEYYYGGRVYVDLPTSLPANYPATATVMRLVFHHVIISNAGLDYTDLQVAFYMTTVFNPTPHWEEFCIITTSPYSADFNRIVWDGTLIHLDATLYGWPPSWSTDNVIQVDEGVLQVERDGNRMYASLNAPQQIKSIPNAFLTLYPFTLEMTKYGGSTHITDTWTMELFPGASGYTFTVEDMYFHANGEFTCPDLYTDEVAVDNARINMNGIHIISPP